MAIRNSAIQRYRAQHSLDVELDLMGCGLAVSPEIRIRVALTEYLERRRTGTARELAEKAVVLLKPVELMGNGHLAATSSFP